MNTEHLACPHCNNLHRSSRLVPASGDVLACSSCQHTFPVHNNLPVLLVDTTLESRLEKNPEAEIHQLKEGAIENTFEVWNTLLAEFHATQGRYLEIGAGNGRLSNGVIRHSTYDEIIITDLSETFIRNIMARNSGMIRPVDFYVCDANHPPFQPNVFDVVVGRSILHHLLHYEKALEEIFRILKPEGKAFFLEPILQGKLWVAFFLKNMLAIDAQSPQQVFNVEQIKKMHHLVRHLTKAHQTGNNLEALSQMEDKYIFDVVAIEALGKKTGFRHFHYRNNSAKGVDLQKEYPVWGYGNHVFSHVKKFGVTREQLAQFDYLFRSFGETFSDHINHQLYTPMGYFIFEK